MQLGLTRVKEKKTLPKSCSRKYSVLHFTGKRFASKQTAVCNQEKCLCLRFEITKLPANHNFSCLNSSASLQMLVFGLCSWSSAQRQASERPGRYLACRGELGAGSKGYTRPTAGKVKRIPCPKWRPVSAVPGGEYLLYQPADPPGCSGNTRKEETSEGSKRPPPKRNTRELLLLPPPPLRQPGPRKAEPGLLQAPVPSQPSSLFGEIGTRKPSPPRPPLPPPHPSTPHRGQARGRGEAGSLRAALSAA